MENQKNYWCYRIDTSKIDFFQKELDKGILRQGWGWDNGQDLKSFTFDGGAGRNMAMFEKVKKGDLLIVPRLPNWGNLTLVEATEDWNKGYKFEIDKDLEDYGHMFPAKSVKVFNREDAIVPPGIRATLGNPSRFWNINHYGEDVESILASKSETNIQKSFSIKANTYTLKGDGDSRAILDGTTIYSIPIYQRPYSWGETEVTKFIDDIFLSFWGVDENPDAEQEPMFIGTMQIAAKEGSKCEHAVIDGQQRLTTLFILLKTLQLKFGKNEVATDFNWLKTNVNNGAQMESLKALSDIHNYEELKKQTGTSQNLYINNAFLISKMIDEDVTVGEDDTPNRFDIKLFIQHLCHHIYFVVIETKAGLSKTLQIFNAINTTGLDLNGSDLFKLRLFEFLSSTEKSQDGQNSIFENISELYSKIERQNKTFGYEVTNMSQILKIYQYIIISKNKLPKSLNKLNQDTFFERFFDSLFKLNTWDGFSSINKEDINSLSIEDINSIIETRYWFENYIAHSNVEVRFALYLFWTSRYSRYTLLIYVFINSFKEHNSSNEKLDVFIKDLNRFYFIYSVRYQKAINEVHNFSFELVDEILKDRTGIDNILYLVKEKNKTWKENINDFLTEKITENPTRKNLICRLSSFLEEPSELRYSNQKEDFDSINKLYFGESFDIEHIQSYHHHEESQRDELWKDWGDEINSLGNLMVLESGINRSISNRPYSEKIKENGDTNYHKSKFAIVKKQLSTYHEWDKERAVLRKQYELNKILAYLFQE